MEIRELTTEDEFRAAFPVMHELRDQLDEGEYLQLVAQMRPGGYRLIAAEEDGRIVALAGIGIGVNFYYRRYLWVYDLITSEAERSKGHGLALMEYLEELARKEGCDTLALASALHRTDAHRFYTDRIGMEKPSYTFSKSLE
jgi:GNAT superfamily N-acetyltransferase